MIDENFIYLGAILNVIGTGSYVIETLKGRAKPNRVTWFLWALAPLLAASAQFREGVGLIALSTFMNGFMPLLVLIASLMNKKAFWQASRFDYLCGSVSLFALILWLSTGKGLLAILLSVLADLMAALPTISKSFYQPETEHSITFLLAFIASSLTLLTIKDWKAENYAFALYIVIVTALLYVLIKFKLGLKYKQN